MDITPIDLIKAQQWGCTEAGFIWYCDAHDTHGNADSGSEAEFMAKAHREYFHDEEECDLSVVEVKPPVALVPEASP